MPIVIASDCERLESVMGLVSTYCRPVLTAIYGSSEDQGLRFWYISLPAKELPSVDAESAETTMADFMSSHSQHRGKIFRITSWLAPALAFEIPLDVRTDRA